jgi:hypothetical protein
MRHEGRSEAAGTSNERSRPDRRDFLRAGAGCAVPLLMGGTVARAMGAATARQGEDPADPVVAFVVDEALRTYHEMAGPAGIHGEHVRTLGMHLDLVRARLQARQDDRRLDTLLRRRVRDTGREATVLELRAGHADLVEAIRVQHGVLLHVVSDHGRAGAALDRLVTTGVGATLRGYRPALRRLAAGIDRVAASREARPVTVAVGQKPVDDFLGTDPGSLTPQSWCDFLTTAIDALNLCAAALGLLGLSGEAGVVTIAAGSLSVLKGSACAQANV